MSSRARGVALIGCMAIGLLVALRAHAWAEAIVGVFLLTLVASIERRRVAKFLWGAVAFTAPLQGLRVGSFLAMSDVLLVLALGVILTEVVRRGRPRVVPSALPACLFLVSAAGLIATFSAPHPITSVANIGRLTLAAGGTVLAFALWHPDRASVVRFAQLWFAGATFNAAYALLTPRLPIIDRAQGLTTQPNHLGLVCMLATGLGLGLALSAPPGRRRNALLAGVAVVSLALVVSGSRGAFLGEVAVVTALAVVAKRPRLLVGTLVVAALLVVAAGTGLVQVPDASALSRVRGGGGSIASDMARKKNLSESFALYAAHPLTGAGFEYAVVAHSIYVQALVLAGPLGLLALVWAATTIVATGLRGIRRSTSQGDGVLLAGLTSGYIGYLGAAVFDNIVWDRYLWVYVSLIIVLAAVVPESEGVHWPTDGAGQPNSRPHGNRWPGQGALGTASRHVSTTSRVPYSL